MADDLELILFFLLVVVTALTALARILDVPYPILLVVGGAAVGFVPGIPDVELEPDLVLLLFLPPLLFNAAYFASVRDLRQNLRVISLQAVLLVLATMCTVAVALHAAVPEIPWAAAFAFGAIVSPTDPLAAVTIAQRVGLPRRIVTVVEGESLVNDGTALVAYRVAVAAAVGGTFDLLDATGDFVVNVLGGAAVGVVVAFVLLQFLKWLVADDTLGVTISLAAGYAGYLPAEHLHVSGVIAAVVVGLILGHQAHLISTAASRLRGYAFWEVLVFLLNAVLFLLVGLQLPAILEDQDRTTGELIALGALAGGTVIGTRLLWSNVTPYIIRAIDRREIQRARRVGWRLRLVGVWAGMRGSVSLAAALALPLDFPERDLLVYLTLCVIFATLVLQGLTLPLLIRKLGIQDDGEEAREELIARKQATRAALDRLETLQAEDWTRDETVERMAQLYRFRYRRLAQRAQRAYGSHPDADSEDTEDLDARSVLYQRTVRDVLDTQRSELVRLRDVGDISDGVLHKLQRELDLEDQRLEI